MAEEMIEYEQPFVFDPAYEAHKMRLAGASWPEVATTLGYPSPHAASMGVSVYLKRAAADIEDAQREEALAMELDRCDALQLAFWGGAIDGDDKAAAVVLKVMGHRAKLLGLESQEKVDPSVGRTIVIGGTPEEYVTGLRELVERQAAEDAEDPEDQLNDGDG